MMNQNCLELDSQSLQSLSSNQKYEQNIKKSEEDISERFKSLISLNKPTMKNGQKFNLPQLNRQSYIISNKQLQIQAQAKKKIQQEKFNLFKSKIKNDEFIKKETQYVKVSSFLMPNAKKTNLSDIQKRINIQQDEIKQNPSQILSKLDSHDEQKQKIKKQQKLKKQQIKAIMNQLTLRNEDKPKIHMFNDSGQRLQSGYRYYLQNKAQKKQIIKNKKLVFRQSLKQKYNNLGTLVDFDQDDKRQQNIKKTVELKKPKPKSFFPSFKLKQERKQEQSEFKLTEAEKQITQRVEGEQQVILTSVPQKLRKHNLKQLIRPIEQPQSHAFIRKILRFQFDVLNKAKPSHLQIQGSYEQVQDYSFVMANLLINQCICDIQMRIRKIVQKKMKPFNIQIQQVEESSQGQIEVEFKLLQSEDETRQVNKQFMQLSEVGYRVGILTNCSQITLLSNYGVPSKNNKKVFAILCYVLVRKAQREREKEQKIKVVGQFEKAQLELILLEQKSKQAWFYDLDKISSHFREYVAISNLQHSELAPLLINPKLLIFFKPQILHLEDVKALQPLLTSMKLKYNKAQFNAIKQISQAEAGIFLLQGPPGTGKTTALMGLIATHFQLLTRANQKNKTDNKILICAPSNTAIDYITKKLKSQGILNAEGKQIFPRLLRTGAIESTDKMIIEATADYLCEQQIERLLKIDQLNTASLNEKIANMSKAFEKDKENLKLKQQLRELQTKLENGNNEGKNQSKKDKKQIYYKILRQSQIILTTLNSSGSQRLDLIRDKISVVIVDEAAQATQPSILIPLQTGAIKIILVGDPQQLPATVLSSDAETTHYNRSLFERLISEGKLPYFLNVQYRMDPLIRAFPSRRFYQNRLQDGENIIERAHNLSNVPACLHSFMGKNLFFINVLYGQEKSQNNSYCNVEESQVVNRVVSKFLQQQQAKVSIGIITPYQSQKKKIDNLLNTSTLMVNTVDSFQGQQKDIIIVSTVRANTRGAVGFLNDDRRTNVTLTRSKHLLLVIGHAQTLVASPSWKAFIQFCNQQHSVYQIRDRTNLNSQIDDIMIRQSKSYIDFNFQEIVKNIKTKFNEKQQKQKKARKTYSKNVDNARIKQKRNDKNDKNKND